MNLLGQKFNKLTVVEKKGKQNRSIMWICKCDCGNQTIVSTGNLRNGNVKACGCLRSKDIEGKTFGNLTAIKFLYRNGVEYYWLFKCDCGNEKVYSRRWVTTPSADIISCGCILKEKARQRFTGSNNPRWKGGIVTVSRKGARYIIWASKVKRRDKMTCRFGNNENCEGRIEAHHIYPWSSFPKKRFGLSNGISLCREHHKKVTGEELNFIPLFERKLWDVKEILALS